MSYQKTALILAAVLGLLAVGFAWAEAAGQGADPAAALTVAAPPASLAPAAATAGRLPTAPASAALATAPPPPTEGQAYGSLPFCTLSADGKQLARQPCRTAPPQRPMPRRPVPQIVEPMPPRAAPPRVAMPPLPPSAPLRAPSPPQPLVNCGAGGCYDAGGAWQGNGVGNTSVAPNGKLCQRNGIWLQCL
jgi:hypothetical protein